MSGFFHAYVIGGDGEEARKHAEGMLARLGSLGPGHPDYLESTHVSFGIDDARAVRAWQELSSSSGGPKACLIAAEFITREAENALLKTLEEPAPNTHIFILTPNPGALLPTTLSRVQVVMPPGAVSAASSGAEHAEAERFLALSQGERLARIATIVEKGDDDEAAAEVRERTLSLMNGLESVLAKDPRTHGEALSLLLKLKKYLYMPGASSRMILETIALTI